MNNKTADGYLKLAKRIKDIKIHLTKPNTPEMLKRKIKPKQKRVKSVSENDLEKLNEKINSSNDSAVAISSLTDCRPTEMMRIKIISPTKIFITGPKKNDDGDRGLDRYLELSSGDVSILNYM